MHEKSNQATQPFSCLALGIDYPYDYKTADGKMIDTKYPGTACERLANVVAKVKNLTVDDLNDHKWSTIRSKLLAVGGLKEGMSTSHSFNDWNHCDLTTMLGSVQSNSNSDGKVAGISRKNKLGSHIKEASLSELGEGGSWSTCILGCNQNPPQDVAHVQFQSRVAFKLVWCPPNYNIFVLLDDEGKILNKGSIMADDTGVPSLQQRQLNFRAVEGGQYEAAAKEAGKTQN